MKTRLERYKIEQILLENLSSNFHFITRNIAGHLAIWVNAPRWEPQIEDYSGYGMYLDCYDHLFKDIKYGEGKVYKIKELRP